MAADADLQQIEERFQDVLEPEPEWGVAGDLGVTMSDDSPQGLAPIIRRRPQPIDQPAHWGGRAALQCPGARIALREYLTGLWVTPEWIDGQWQPSWFSRRDR